MLAFYYITAAIATVSAIMVVGRHNTVHALLYLVVTMLALAVLFYLLGAPFAAALEVIVYAGAIMVLVVFVIMMLNQGDSATAQEQQWFSPGCWWGPAVLSTLLLLEILMIIKVNATGITLFEGNEFVTVVTAKQVGIDLFGPYLLAVELASFLLLAGLVGAFHIARNLKKSDSG
jgi:NADH-quinone oxidoreductase subunit J